MLMSEKIARMLEEMLNEQDGSVEIQRNELATRFGCVPSQINYVISSRFSPQRGYIVESRRGGGGYVKITRVRVDSSRYLMHLLASVGTSLDSPCAKTLLTALYENRFIDEKDLRIFASVVSDSTLGEVRQKSVRDALRADIMRSIILNLV